MKARQKDSNGLELIKTDTLISEKRKKTIKENVLNTEVLAALVGFTIND